MSGFTVYPAIDLRDGRVVRLQQGDPQRMTVYGDDPLAVAAQWVEAGARWLHVVNLDGAFGEGGQRNQEALAALCKQFQPIHTRIQFGGGLRSPADVERALAQGVSRVVLGTLAFEQPAVLEECLHRFGAQSIAVAVDVKEGEVVVRGWQETGRLGALEACHQMVQNGVQTLIYTDISRDGMGSGLNVEFAGRILQSLPVELILSGGVRGLEDVRAVLQLGAAGIIIGKALYDGRIDLKAALKMEAEPC